MIYKFFIFFKKISKYLLMMQQNISNENISELSNTLVANTNHTLSSIQNEPTNTNINNSQNGISTNNQIIINPNLCMARKNQKENFMVQCPHIKKFGDFCGKHKNYLQHNFLKINETSNNNNKCIPILSSTLTLTSTSTSKDNFDNINNKNNKNLINCNIKINQNIDNFLLKNNINKKYNRPSRKKHIYKYNILPLSPIIPLDLLSQNEPILKCQNISPRVVKKSIIYYKLKKKSELSSMDLPKMIEIMQHFIHFLFNCIININKLIKIQRYTKKWILNNKIKIQGPATFNINLCHNSTDIYNLDELKEIDNKYLFSYLDVDNFVYGFHIESFIEFINQNRNKLNPYNRNEIPKYVIDKAKDMWSALDKRKQKSKMIQNTNYKDIRLRVKNKIITTLQKIDYFGYQTNIDWIYNLSLNRLKILYRNLSIIWFYRANLTHEVRNNIVPMENLFSDNIHRQVIRQLNKYSVMEIIIDIMNKMVSKGITDSDKNQGCIIVLMAIAEISPECASNNSWLL